MNDKERRRQKRKEKKAKRRSASNVIDPNSIVPLAIPGDVNLYDYFKDVIRSGRTTDLMLQDIDIEQYMSCIDETLEHFQTPLDMRSKRGNVIIRFSIMYGEQEDGKHFQIASDDDVMNRIADWWEHFQRLYEKRIREE